MQTSRHFHMELRHATMPTYVFSYLFPLVLLAYELWRVGSWVAVRGFNFSDFNSMGYEFALMLAVFAMQIVVEIAFMAAAMLTKHHDVVHRAGNLLLGVFCSMVVLGFDLALQYAM
ncbi:hypothetical protein [Caballeronia mineralivorans]|jgi:hypothetical protein|uniref:hypothetical protein n=1 Tax=Caballeronia mineralivorans TaxID=2010198 RepID=UPI0023F0021A|nr:hypothetical protein [Caballeronia mineralivorans]MDB5789478.1 hypothetical protein [Caballeronia mineralivorans]MEA3096272.1 hypothetical protein [Caballeronia mineralivorans]